MIKKILSIIYDHWLQVFGALLSIGGISLIINNWESFKKLFLKVISQPITGWIVLFLVIVVLIIKKRIEKRKKPVAFFLEPGIEQPKYKRKDLKRFTKLRGVLWNLWEGYDFLSIDNDGGRLWVDGPFCPLCKYELDRENEEWKCAKCKKSFKIPREIREDTIRKIIKFFEAELRK